MKKRILTVFDYFFQVIAWPFKSFGNNNQFLGRSKILVCRLDHIGDVMMTTPAFRAIKEGYPQAQVFVLTNEAGRSILKGNPFIDGFYTFNWPWHYDERNNRFTSQHYSELWSLVKEIRKQKFDVFIDFRGDIRMLFAWGVCTGIPTRVFYNRIGGGSLATHIAEHVEQIHELERVGRTLQLLNIPVKQERPELFLQKSDYEAAWNLRQNLSSHDPVQPYIIISPYAAKGIKEWKIEYWNELIQLIEQDNDLDIYIIGTKENFKSAENLVLGKIRTFNLCGKTTLREVGALLSKAKLVIGVDTGTLHMASSFNIPLISIFGPTFSLQFKPYSPFGKVIDLDICTCDKRKYFKCANLQHGTPYCLNQLTPQMVWGKIETLLSDISSINNLTGKNA